MMSPAEAASAAHPERMPNSYQETVLPIRDRKPKFRDMPDEMGGSGVNLAVIGQNDLLSSAAATGRSWPRMRHDPKINHAAVLQAILRARSPRTARKLAPQAKQRANVP